MKLKKITSIALLAAMSFSAIGASARVVSVPQPKDNAEAYALAEAFYHDGYYYEAHDELLYVNPSGTDYDYLKQAAWLEKVNYKIDRMTIQQILADVKKLNSDLDFQGGLNRLADANNCTITALEYYSLSWWENALKKNLADPKYAAKAVDSNAVVTSGISAIGAIKADCPLNSEYEWYSPVKVDGGYHVYIKTRTPDGDAVDVAAYRVGSDGTFSRVF